LADSENQYNFCDDWGQQLHGAQNDVDESSSFASLCSLDELKVSQYAESLLDFTIDDHVKQQGANDSNSIGLSGRWLVLETNVDKEKHRYQNLHSKHNEALLKCETLLQRRAALGHIGTNCIVVDIVCKFKLLVLFVVRLFHDQLVLMLARLISIIV